MVNVNKHMRKFFFYVHKRYEVCNPYTLETFKKTLIFWLMQKCLIAREKSEIESLLVD